MKDKKAKQISQILLGTALLLSLIYSYFEISKPKVPNIEALGNINGEYNIASISALNKPYVCIFEKSDENSNISGSLHILGENVYGDFRIVSKILDGEPFRSFLLIKDGESYTWTSLASVGYKSKPAKSAWRNASPSEQAQIVGLKDKIEYDCKILENIDPTIFGVPDWINFKEV